MHEYARRLRALASPRSEMPKVNIEGTKATLRLYDPIDSWGGEWGLSAKELTDALDELPPDVEEIQLHINSPGGEVFEGIAVLNALRAHKARVVAVVDGVAASAASFVACGADELVMARNSELMIHDAWGLCIGNAEDMRALAEDLDRISDNIASVYAEKTGGEIADWRAAMSRESWYSAEEAVAAGLADRVDKKTASKNSYDLSIFKFNGRADAPDPQAPPEPAPVVDATDPADEPPAEDGADMGLGSTYLRLAESMT